MSLPPDASTLDTGELASAVEARIRDYLQEELGAEQGAAVGLNDDLWGRLDSMLMLDLVANLERTFDVQLNASDLRPERLRSIAELRDYTVLSLQKK